MTQPEIRVLNIEDMHPVLVLTDTARVLIDTSVPKLEQALLDAIREEGVEPETITHLLITHQDFDHFGCAKALAGRCPNMQLWCHETEAPFLEGAQTPVKLTGLAEDHEMRVGYANRTLPVQRTLRDGELLPLAGGIRAIHTPGHTPGHVCYLIETLGTLVAGDAVNGTEEGLRGPNPIYTQNMDEAVRAAKALERYDIRRVVPFHGPAFEGDVRAALRAL